VTLVDPALWHAPSRFRAVAHSLPSMVTDGGYVPAPRGRRPRLTSCATRPPGGLSRVRKQRAAPRTAATCRCMAAGGAFASSFPEWEEKTARHWGTVSPSESRASRPIHRSTARRGRPTPGGVLVHMSVTTASNTTVTDSDVGMFHPPCPRPPGPLRTGTAKAQRWSRLLPASAGPSLVRHVLFVPSPQLEPPRRKGTSVTNPANRQSVR
jgi:hypothetical protein